MDKEIKQRIESYLDTLEKGANTATEFAIEQAPLVVQEFLAWEFWSNVTIAAFSLAAFIVAALALKFIRKVSLKKPFDDCDFFIVFVGSAISLAAIIISTLAFASSTRHAVKAKVAPRIIILEKVRELTR